jgi:hypothetical protein
LRKITIDHHLKKEEIEKIFSEQSEVGRYQIVLGTLAVKQTYMIDTKTGRIWNFVVVPHREVQRCGQKTMLKTMKILVIVTKTLMNFFLIKNLKNQVNKNK